MRLIANLATAAGAIWVTNGDHAQYGRLFQVDPRRRRITARLTIPGAPSGVVEARGVLWIAASDTGYLFRLDPHTAKLVAKPVRAGKALLTVAADTDRIWVGDSYAGAVNSVDTRTGTVVTRTKLPTVSDVAVGDGAVWATVDKPSELVRLNPKTGAPVGRPLPVRGTASGLTIGFGSIWVMTGDDSFGSNRRNHCRPVRCARELNQREPGRGSRSSSACAFVRVALRPWPSRPRSGHLRRGASCGFSTLDQQPFSDAAAGAGGDRLRGSRVRGWYRPTEGESWQRSKRSRPSRLRDSRTVPSS